MHSPLFPNAAMTAGRPAARAALVLLATAGLFAPAALAQETGSPASAAMPTAAAVETGPAPATPATPAEAEPLDVATAPEGAMPAPEEATAPADAAPPETDASDAAASVQDEPVDPAAVSLQDDATPAPQNADAPLEADATARQGDDGTLATADERTDAERDFDALYGPYNPVADPTLPPPAQVRGAYDPWEPLNRRMHRFNNVVDRNVARPLARTYVKVVPRPMRLGVGNFFNNLGQPVSALNALLQGKPKQAAQSLGRFVLNTTLGIGGIFDPASDAKLPNRSEDFGQTLGIWGWKRSRYVELPLFGPRTLRDVFGMVGDAPLSPLRQVDADRIRVPIQGMQLVDIRAQLLSTDSLREGAEDDYALVRDAWSQRRDYQIFGDRLLEGDESLPDYLREENNPTVPVDAMPVMPTDGG